MSNQKKPITAGELLSQLEKNAAYVEMMRQKDEERRINHEQFQRESKPVIEALANDGVVVDSVYDIYLLPNPEEAIPALLQHLQKPYSDRVRSGIATGLAIKKAKGLFEPLRDAFEREQSKSVKEALADAITKAASPKDLPAVIELVRNPMHGQARIILLTILRRSKRPEAKKALLELREDSQLAYQLHLYGL